MTDVPDGTYRHKVPHLTVGQLLQALKELPAEMSIRISVAATPTGYSPRDPYDHDFVLAGTRIYDGNDVPSDYLILDADFSSGLYMLPERDRGEG
jgi:Family of unknown function (DUF6225)